MSADWKDEVIGFWFGLDPGQWWAANAQIDEEIRNRFHDIWSDQRMLPASSFFACARSALASVILFDQFPRNMFRNHAEQFATDPLALAIAKGAIDAGLDALLDKRQRGFLYMPFMHSEDLDDQRRAVLLFTALGDDEQLDYARKHHDVIERFGRFPHRNAVLGRAPRPDEARAGDVVPW